MDLYSVILVDDEEEVRRAISRKIDWESIGFQLIGTAENGEEALELAEHLKPDVVMTDIKMPFMDGLTLCKKLKEVQRNTKIVIFTGFDHFEYAKEAIKLEVEEYVLKPVNSAELKNVFLRLKEKLDHEMDEKRNVEKLKKYYLESLPVMKEQFISGLLEGRIQESKIEELSTSYEMHLEAPYYGVAVVRFDMGRNSEEYADTFPDKQLLMVSMKQIVDENLESQINFKSLFMLDSIAVLALLEEENEIERFIYNMDQICQIGHRVLGVNITAGIGKACQELHELAESYAGAESAISYSVLLEPNQAIYINDIEPNTESIIMIEDDDVQSIIKEIKFGTEEMVVQAVDILIENIRNSNISLYQYQLTMLELVIELLKIGRSFQLDMQQIFGEKIDIYREIRGFESLNIMESRLKEVALNLYSVIRRERMDSKKALTARAIQYISDNYQDSKLSVDMICSYLKVSPGYFSTVFKKETGMSFVMYLTKVRMDAAVELLNTTEDMTYIISEKVGYMEPNYFSYVFKKQFGISPSKYRASKSEKKA